MSTVPSTFPPANPLETREAARAEAGPARFSKSWVILACLLLGASGVVRVVQDRRFGEENGGPRTCPIDLSKISATLGDWRYIKGSDQKLPELTMRITGGTDYVIRAYSNDFTGVTLLVLILYGPAEPVMPHVPEICYPASGFMEGDAPINRTIAYSSGEPGDERAAEGKAVFRSASYFKPSGRVLLRDAVYHSFRLGNRWDPNVAASRTELRRNPGIFKVQIQRQMTEGETLGKGDPIEQFLGVLMADLERQLKVASTKKVASP